MSKAVLASIQPPWCEKIAVREKSLEVRKTRPNIPLPFKCYIYCTKTTKGWFWFDSPNIRRDGTVIGEFVCDSIRRFDVPYPAYQNELDKQIIVESCLTYYQLHRYAFHDDLYGWRISDLVIYDRPMELAEFHGLRKNKFSLEPVALNRPPQSWCYVEEIGK